MTNDIKDFRLMGDLFKDTSRKVTWYRIYKEEGSTKTVSNLLSWKYMNILIDIMHRNGYDVQDAYYLSDDNLDCMNGPNGLVIVFKYVYLVLSYYDPDKDFARNYNVLEVMYEHKADDFDTLLLLLDILEADAVSMDLPRFTVKLGKLIDSDDISEEIMKEDMIMPSVTVTATKKEEPPKSIDRNVINRSFRLDINFKSNCTEADYRSIVDSITKTLDAAVLDNVVLTYNFKNKSEGYVVKRRD